MKRLASAATLILCWLLPLITMPAPAQQEQGGSGRKIVNRVVPVYPPLARTMNLRGTVRLDAIVQVNGTVKTVELKGGHPVLAQAAEKYKQAAPFLDDGRPAAAAQDACGYWPVPPTGQPHLPNVAGLAPVLVVSTTNDPATPYQAGVNLANALHGGLVTFRGTQHTAFLQGNSCVDKLGTDYLINLKQPPTGATC